MIYQPMSLFFWSIYKDLMRFLYFCLFYVVVGIMVLNHQGWNYAPQDSPLLWRITRAFYGKNTSTFHLQEVHVCDSIKFCNLIWVNNIFHPSVPRYLIFARTSTFSVDRNKMPCIARLTAAPKLRVAATIISLPLLTNLFSIFCSSKSTFVHSSKDRVLFYQPLPSKIDGVLSLVRLLS